MASGSFRLPVTWRGGCTRLLNTPDAIWGPRSAGRALQIQTDSYDLYGNSAASARRLSRWVDEELSSFGERYGWTPEERGLIYAIDAGPDPVYRAEVWQGMHVDRSRDSYWAKYPKGAGGFSNSGGRPYIWSRGEPFFRESFCIPYEAAVGLDLLDMRAPRPSWICFLTTDQHQKAAGDDHHREWRKRQAAEGYPRGGDPFVIYLIVELWAAPKQRDLDRRMMHLQRREALWTAMLSRRGAWTEILALRDEIDVAHYEIFRRRPRD